MLTRFVLLVLGCWLIPQSLLGQELSFPTAEWKTVAADEIGWDAKKLDEAIEFAFERRTTSLVILHGGRILAERHESLENPERRYRGTFKGENDLGHVKEDVASVQKSIVSFLTGVAIEKGLLKLEDRVDKHLGVGWSKARPQAEANIKIRHLLTMTSGLNPRLQAIAPAGKRWQYNSTVYGRTLRCLEKASGMSANELTSAWLLDRIGMKDSKWQPRVKLAASTDANDMGFVTTARDLARFGLLIQARGEWGGESILGEKAYLTQALNSSQELNPAYGFLWWLNGKESLLRQGKTLEGPMIKSAPDDLVAALGALGRKCYVVPSQNLVVTRLGDLSESNGQESFNDGFWRRLMLAIPKTR
ncbi:MAG: serine hydrolase [Planctomycetota bacterium]